MAARVQRLALLWIVFGLLAAPGRAQDRPTKGMVWTPPPSLPRAERALRTMHARGVQAVRTPLVRDERLLAVADTLGLQWYQDLPLAYLAAPALADTIDYAREQLNRVLAVAQRHPSARHFGLARLSDTSDPAACSVLQQLAAVVQRQGPPGSQTYYVTPFTTADRCGAAVDQVLLDVRNAARPAQRLQAWQRAHPETPVGLGALGTWVRRDTVRGLRAPHSPEAQARYLERHLGSLLADTLQAPLASVFIYRWRDAADSSSDPYGRPYGVHAADGTPRPAADVVEGFFTSTQTVFAFTAGQQPAAASPWLVVMGWALIGLMALVYYRGPRFQQMVMRYFSAHNFYQESVREGREVLVGSMLVLVAGELAGIAALGAVLGRCFQNAQPVLEAMQALPAPVHAVGAALMDQPALLGLALAGGYGLSLLVWMGGLMGVGRYGTSLSAGQVLMLMGGPRWPLLLVMVTALALSSLAPETGRSLVLWLLASTGGLMLWMTGRTVADFIAVTRVPVVLAVIPVLISPLFTVFWAGGLLIARYDVPVTFIGHLLTRT